MDPVTMMMILGFSSQAIGGISSAKSQSKALYSQAQAATDNAYAARLKAQADAQTQLIQARAVIGRQSGEFAASNLEGGSVFAVLADSTANAELDRLNIIFNGKVRASAFESEAASNLDAASNIHEAGLFNLLGTGFMGAAAGMKG